VYESFTSPVWIIILDITAPPLSLRSQPTFRSRRSRPAIQIPVSVGTCITYISLRCVRIDREIDPKRSARRRARSYRSRSTAILLLAFVAMLRDRVYRAESPRIVTANGRKRRDEARRATRSNACVRSLIPERLLRQLRTEQSVEAMIVVDDEIVRVRCSCTLSSFLVRWHERINRNPSDDSHR